MHMGAAPAESMNSDFEELLSIFNENGVRYLIVGGHAVCYIPNRDTRRIWMFRSIPARKTRSGYIGHC